MSDLSRLARPFQNGRFRDSVYRAEGEGGEHGVAGAWSIEPGGQPGVGCGAERDAGSSGRVDRLGSAGGAGIAAGSVAAGGAGLSGAGAAEGAVSAAMARAVGSRAGGGL